MNISANISDAIQSALSISKKLFALAETTGLTYTEVNKLATEITILASTSNILRSSLNNSDGCRYSIGAVSIAQKVLDRCQDIFGALDRILIGLQLEGSGKEEIIPRMKNEFENTEVKILRGTLEACNFTLHLILHNLTIAKKPIARRASLFIPDIETEQHELITKTLQTSRQNTITFLEYLENGRNNATPLASSRSNKLRKLKLSSKSGQTKHSKIQKERASDWIRSLIRDERNNALIPLEFSPRVREDTEGFGGFWERKVNGWERKARAGVGELPGDGPDNLPSRSERIEYAWLA
ncbi:hypothetical protein BKA64DRAFT_413066 [Cadophora sp. MPI-SDFR-AT-0126]|nr:hypothetical protein BKA64DRAFT_413066 [Leotiomycetes sp. MPI-SDFR-AT-0126]